jgi:hypothetical protein
VLGQPQKGTSSVAALLAWTYLMEGRAMADWQEDSNAHCRENDANALCATCGKTWANHIGRCCDGDESSERRFKLAGPVDARPVCWYEAEERCRGMPLHILLSPNGQMCHSGRFHWTVTRPDTTNPVWPLYAAAGVAVLDGSKQ